MRWLKIFQYVRDVLLENIQWSRQNMISAEIMQSNKVEQKGNQWRDSIWKDTILKNILKNNYRQR